MGLTAPEKGKNAGVKSNDNLKKGKKKGGRELIQILWKLESITELLISLFTQYDKLLCFIIPKITAVKFNN